jgi:hypothetical protein
MESPDFWDIIPGSPVNVSRHSEGNIASIFRFEEFMPYILEDKSRQRILFSGVSCPVVCLKSTDVSEEYVVSMFRVE